MLKHKCLTWMPLHGCVFTRVTLAANCHFVHHENQPTNLTHPRWTRPKQHTQLFVAGYHINQNTNGDTNLALSQCSPQPRSTIQGSLLGNPDCASPCSLGAQKLSASSFGVDCSSPQVRGMWSHQIQSNEDLKFWSLEICLGSYLMNIQCLV